MLNERLRLNFTPCLPDPAPCRPLSTCNLWHSSFFSLLGLHYLSLRPTLKVND
ncbi:unnamed protein product, partial [Gulo gulo]